MEINVKKDRLEINKIIENCLPLIKLNKRTHRKCDDKYFDELPVTHCPLKTKQDEKDSLGVVKK